MFPTNGIDGLFLTLFDQDSGARMILFDKKEKHPRKDTQLPLHYTIKI